jgi:arylsulfatase A-like enzyme
MTRYGSALRRIGLITALLLAAATISPAGVAPGRAGAASAHPASGQPNIITIMTDDQTVASLSVMPNVRTLIAKQGVSFKNSFVSWSLCCPSRVTYLTGQFAHNHGVLGTLPPYGGFGAFKHQETTFPNALQRAGYDTIHIGKYINGFGRILPVTVPPGWSEFHGGIDPSTYNYSKFKLLENGNVQRSYTKRDGYQTDVYTRIATSTIRDHAEGDRPFFLNVAYLAPHAQARELKRLTEISLAVPAPRDRGTLSDIRVPHPPGYNEADVSDKPPTMQALPRFTAKRAAKIQKAYELYHESLLAVDRGVERIVTTLKKTKELDNTVIIFTSDNGFMFGEHRIPTGKIVFYEPSIRVPLIMRGPGIPKDETRQVFVQNIDLAPTILALARATPLRQMDGESLVPILQAEPAPNNRTLLLEAGGAPYFPRWGVRSDRYVYWRYDQKLNELYDLQKDPYELRNVVNDPAYAAVRADMESRHDRLARCAGATSCDLRAH